MPPTDPDLFITAFRDELMDTRPGPYRHLPSVWRGNTNETEANLNMWLSAQ